MRFAVQLVFLLSLHLPAVLNQESAWGGPAQERASAGELEPPAILLRTPGQLPRAEAGRWEGFFAGDTEKKVGAELAPAVSRTLDSVDGLYRGGDYVAALEALFALLEQEPDLPPAWLVTGTVYFRLRRYEDAIVSYERFLHVAPEELWRTQALGHAYYSLGEYERARDHYALVLAGAPKSVEAAHGLALAHMRLGEETRALVLLKRVIEARPAHAEAHAWFATILFEQERSEDSLPFAERARELAPFEPRPWYLLSQILYDLGREEQAASVEERWRELDRVAQELRKIDGLLRIHPRRFELVQRSVELHASVGNAAAVRGGLERMLAFRPPELPEVQVRIHALDVLWQMGETAGAADAAAALEAACPDEVEAWQRLELYYAGIRDRLGQMRAGERYRHLRGR